jgi:hypothetical protein
VISKTFFVAFLNDSGLFIGEKLIFTEKKTVTLPSAVYRPPSAVHRSPLAIRRLPSIKHCCSGHKFFSFQLRNLFFSG